MQDPEEKPRSSAYGLPSEVVCWKCQGSGAVDGPEGAQASEKASVGNSETEQCPVCRGKGKVPRLKMRGKGVAVEFFG